MASSRVKRARESEAAVAALLREFGWENAERVPANRPGEDIVNGIAGAPIEVKSAAEFSPVAFYRQAKKYAKNGEAVPFVVYRPNGAGVETVGQWLVIASLEDMLKLLKAGGYASDDQSR